MCYVSKELKEKRDVNSLEHMRSRNAVEIDCNKRLRALRAHFWRAVFMLHFEQRRTICLTRRFYNEVEAMKALMMDLKLRSR